MTPINLKLAVPAAAAALFIAACSGEAPSSADAPDYDAIAAAAVADPDRYVGDAENDAGRKPEASLAFFQVAPGMTVFEIEAGGGYYTELLSRAVGPDGEVVMQNPEGFLAFVGDEINARLADDRLANVRQSLSVFDDFGAEDESVDLVTWVWGPHELYYKPEDGTDLGDPETAYAEIFRITKPGGAFAVIDHAAVDGAPATTGHDVHRIDKAIVVDMAEAAGFTLEAEGDFLANSDDDRTTNVFDPAIRGQTDQFALRFRKPE